MFKKILVAVLALLAAAAFAAVDVNKGSAAELDGVKGIGPALSTKIVDERKKGAFKDWQDFIDRVKGVGEGSAAKLSAEGLTVNGGSFKGVAPAAKPAPAAAPAAPAAKATAAAPAAPAAPAAKAADVKPAADPKADAKAAKEAAKAEKEAKKKADKEAKEKAKADAKAAKEAKKAEKAAAAASAAKK